MDTTARGARTILDPSWATPSSDTAGQDNSSKEADAVRRSEENILRWMRYLPQDCINRMIEMGWDVST